MTTSEVHPLKAHVAKLVTELRQISTGVRSGGIDRAIAVQRFLHVRPDLEVAAKAISAHIPRSDNSIIVEAQIGNLRIFKYDVLTMIATGPVEPLIEGQIDVIADGLERDSVWVN